MNDSNNYGGTFSPYEDLEPLRTGEDTSYSAPHNEDKGEMVNPIDNYREDRDNGMGDGNDGEDYTLDDNYFANTDISDITDIDSRKPPLNAAQLILDEKLNLVINGIRIIVDRLDTIEELIRNDDE